MSVPFSTNELLLRSDRIAFGKIPPEVPSNEERVLILPNTTGQYLYFGLSTLVSTNAVVGTLEAIYPQFASFTFDNLNNRLGIGTNTPQYTLDIQTTSGVRISGGTLIASGTGLTSVPTAALFSTLPTSVFAPGTIPASAFISSGSLPGVSVPTSALFSTLPTSLFAPSSIPLVALQSSGIIVASSFVGDGFYLSNIPLANINGTITGNFFQPNTIPLSTLASTGQIWIRDSVGSVLAPIMSTGQFQASSITARNISTFQLQTGTLVASTIQANIFQSVVFSASNLSAINIKASSIEVLCMVSTGRFYGDGENITNLTPANLNTVIPSDKFGYRLIAMDALNPFGDFSYEAGLWTYKQPVTVDIQGIFTVSSIRGDGSQLTNLNFVSSPSLVSTVAGLGTAGYLSTGAIGVLTANLVSSLVGLGTFGYISSQQLLSTVTGLGSAGYVSTASLVSTTQALQTAGFLSTQVLTSTVAGLGTAGYVSSLSLVSTTQALTTAGYLSSANLLSTVTGLGSAGYVSSFSTFNLSTQNLFTSTVTFLDINDSSRQVLAVSSGTLVLNGLGIAGAGGTGVSLANLTSTVTGLGTTGYVSTLTLNQALSSFSTAFGPGGTNMDTLTSTVTGLGTAGYVSTLTLNAALSSFSTAFGPGGTNMNTLTSTVEGLGSAGYVSTLTLTSTITALGIEFTQYLQNIFPSTVVGLGSAGYVSTQTLNTAISSFSTALGPGGGTITLENITSTVTGLGTAGYVSTQTLNQAISSFSTAFGPGGGTITLQNITSTVAGLGTAGYASTSFVGAAISSFSTAFGPPGGGSVTTANLTSTVVGLGTSGYISSLSLRSTVAGLGLAGYVSTTAMGAFFSSLSTSYRNNFNTVTSVISALTVSSLTFGTGDGFLAMPDIRPTAVSTFVTQTSSLQAFNLQIGENSTITAIQYFGLLGNYNNTVIAERSTGAGIQEFLVFKGSSVSDQIRFQTTGIFEIETGVSARLWPNVSQNVVPSFLIDVNSNVGIQTAAPGATLDVAGTARAQLVSTQALNVSSLRALQLNVFSLSSGNVFGSSFNLLDPFTNATNFLTVSSGVLLLNGAGISGGSGGAGVSQIVAGNNISISPIGGTGVVTITGTSPSPAELTSTVLGLGTVGYVSTLSLVSTTFALQTAGFLSAPNVLNLVSTQGLSTVLYSTIASLGAFGYVSTASLVSTTLGLQMSGFLSTPTLTSTVAGLGTATYVSTLSLFSAINTSISSFSTALGAVGGGGGGIATIPNNLSTMAFFTSSLVASTMTASTIFVSSISGLLSQFATLSSLTINVSSFYTATRQATPMFITF